MKQEIIHVVDSLGVTHEQVVERADWTISRFFVEGGLGGMMIITLLLVGLTQIFDAIQRFGDVSFSIVCGGLKVALHSTIYGLVVYFLSLIIRVIQKPRI